MTDAPGPAPAETPQPPPSAPPAASWQSPPPQPGPAPGVSFAPHGPRLIAYIIDTLIIGLVLSAVIVIGAVIAFAGTSWAELRAGSFNSGHVTPAMAGRLVGFVVFTFVVTIVAFGYFPFFWARGGQTPGMKLFNLYVVRDSDGGPLSAGQAILRLFGLWVAAVVFYIGFIWVFIDARRRGWQDLIAGTCVIERRG
jgi:uncharacterized RDD family membrane protein YckC